jgi:hypothetical protein
MWCIDDLIFANFDSSSFGCRGDFFWRANQYRDKEMTQEAGTGTGKYEQLLERCSCKLAPVPTAVAHPCEVSALAGAVEAAELMLINPSGS